MALDYVELMRGSAAGIFAACMRALDEAAASGQLREANQAASDVLGGALVGPLDFDEIRSFGEELRLSDDPIRISTGLAAILAADVAQGVDPTSTERSWRSAAEGNGLVWLGAVHGAHIAELELESGAFEAAERRVWDARQTVVAMGDVWYLNAMNPILAFAVDGQGRTNEFLRIADQYEAQMTMFDREARIQRQVLRARALRHRGRLDDAEVAARTGLELVESTDLLPTRAAVLTELSIVLAARGFEREAASYEESAIEVYRKKGNLAAIAALTHNR
jgi:tetratricopeptide (TPR) repeat protein